MIPIEIVSVIALFYAGLLFFVAHYADRRHAQGRSITANSPVYTLSITVYFTSWAFYGSIGQAATSGIIAIAPFLGISLMSFTWCFLLRKLVRVCKEQNILSIADFISSRYGKSAGLGAAVTVFSILAVVPYIASQLKAISYSFDLLTAAPLAPPGLAQHPVPALEISVDTAFIASGFLALFAILFGARRLDASQRHDGVVAAMALQAVVKLVAALSVGLFVCYGLFDGFGDIFSQFAARFPDRIRLFLIDNGNTTYPLWFSWMVFTMTTVMFLPRQFQMLVLENADEGHIPDATWRFPVYTFLITLFIVPIAMAGSILSRGDTSGADFFALMLPLQTGHPFLALLVFIGGLSASAGMVVVESMVLGTMILNHLAIPVLLKLNPGRATLAGLLINIKRAGIVAVILAGYLYYRGISRSSPLIDVGIISLIAATQFTPAIIGGLYWRRATRHGALAGIVLGFGVWCYTLLLPLLVRAGWLERSLLEQGPFHLSLLRPLELFGLKGLDMLSHALFWTIFFNLGAFIAGSLLFNQEPADAEQAVKFVDVLKTQGEPQPRRRLSRAPSLSEFVELLTKFIGPKQAESAIRQYLGDQPVDRRGAISEYELPLLKRHTERVLAGSVGAASAGIIVDSYLSAHGSQMEDVFDIFGTVTLSRTASREQLGVLYEAARVVAGGTDLDQTLDKILEQLQQQFKFDICAIRLLDQEKSCLTVRSQRGMSSLYLDASERELNRETSSGRSYLENEAVVVNDTEAMERPGTAQVLRREGVTSLAHAPIRVDGRPVGVLSAFSKGMKGIFTDEFVTLFQSLAGQIGVALRNAEQTERLLRAREHENELQIARTIQLGLLPTRAPDLPGIALAGLSVPAREVGGDYYDFLPHGEDAVDLVMADVSGHNVGAALIMAETRALIQASAKARQSPGEVLASLNELLCDDLSRTELFITMCYLNYRTGSGALRYANAGHNPPLLLRRGGELERLDAEGLILGITPTVEFEEKEAALQSGDLLCLYTDGIIEAAAPSGEMFGEERLCALLAESRSLQPERIVARVLAAVREFGQSQHLEDDVSLVVLKVS